MVSPGDFSRSALRRRETPPVEVLVTEDAPSPLNPLGIKLVKGQLVGGFVQGLGDALSS
jgi:hypothetical protein